MVKISIFLILLVSMSHACLGFVPCTGVDEVPNQQLQETIRTEYARLNTAIKTLKTSYENKLEAIKINNKELEKLKTIIKEDYIIDEEILFFKKKYNKLLSNAIEKGKIQ